MTHFRATISGVLFRAAGVRQRLKDSGAPNEMGSAMRRNQRRSILLGLLPGTCDTAAAATLGLALLAGCGGPPPVRHVTNPDPSGKIPAIIEAVKKGDRSALPQLVKDLDNDDPAVRLYSIEGLRRITGHTFGYNYYDDEDERQPSIQLWKQWLAKQ